MMPNIAFIIFEYVVFFFLLGALIYMLTHNNHNGRRY